jgi:hypothetical protein
VVTEELAAAGADWDAARQGLAAALAAMPCATARAAAEELVTERLPVLERAHPGDDWARRALAGEPAGPPAEYAGPGGNSLANAVERVVETRSADGDACRRLAAEAIAEAVMGVLAAAWGARHPDDWAGWYAAALRPDPNRPAPPLGLWDDPEVRNLAGRQWRAVARKLAARQAGE